MHWRNSQFQVLHFLIGKCKTADEAYRVAIELREERLAALATNARFSFHRIIRRAIVFLFGADALDLQALACRDEARREVVFLTEIIERVRPLRQYGHLPDVQAFQISQREEWGLCLLDRAQNMLLSTGSIPWDHLETMRAHPDWESSLKKELQRRLPGMHQALEECGSRSPEFMRALASVAPREFTELLPGSIENFPDLAQWFDRRNRRSAQ